MTLEKYAKILDKVVTCKVAWVCAEKGIVKMFRTKPICKEIARNVYTWESANGQKPILTVRYQDGDLDFKEYTDRTGKIDWSACRVKV